MGRRDGVEHRFAHGGGHPAKQPMVGEAFKLASQPGGCRGEAGLGDYQSAGALGTRSDPATYVVSAGTASVATKPVAASSPSLAKVTV